MKRFRGGLVFKAHRLVHYSTLGSRVIKKKKKVPAEPGSSAPPYPHTAPGTCRTPLAPGVPNPGYGFNFARHFQVRKRTCTAWKWLNQILDLVTLSHAARSWCSTSRIYDFDRARLFQARKRTCIAWKWPNHNFDLVNLSHASCPCSGFGSLSLGEKARNVDIRQLGKGNSNYPGARPVQQIISMMKWIRTSRLSMHDSLSGKESIRVPGSGFRGWWLGERERGTTLVARRSHPDEYL